jgi:AcrR family transcriptional regulator
MGRPKIISDDTLLACAREVFLERGTAASTKEIARRAGTSEATVFKRFPTKAALFLAAMVPPKLDVAAVVDTKGFEHKPKAALHAISARMVTEFKARIPLLRRLLEHPDVEMRDVETYLGQPNQRPTIKLAEALASRLQEFEKKKLVRSHDSLAAASLLVSAIHNLVAFDFSGMDESTHLRKSTEAFVEAMWTGLAQVTPRDVKGAKHE